MNNIKWKTVLGLCLLVPALIFDLRWVWGGLFLFWAVNDFRNRRTYFIEDISREINPVLYWIIITVWVVLALISFVPDFWWYR